jgi:hypothetical protein
VTAISNHFLQSGSQAAFPSSCGVPPVSPLLVTGGEISNAHACLCIPRRAPSGFGGRRAGDLARAVPRKSAYREASVGTPCHVEGQPFAGTELVKQLETALTGRLRFKAGRTAA